MSRSTGHEDREDYEPIGGIVLPNERIGNNVAMSFFVDLHRDVVFVIPRGGLDSYIFWELEDLWHLEDIDAAGVMIERYFEIFNEVSIFIQIDEEDADGSSPLPPVKQIKDMILTRAKVQRSSRTN